MQAAARMASVVSSALAARRRLIRNVDMAPVLASGNVGPLSFSHDLLLSDLAALTLEAD